MERIRSKKDDLVAYDHGLLKYYLNNKNITLTQASSMIGRSYSYLTKPKINMHDLEKLCAHIGIDSAEIVTSEPKYKKDNIFTRAEKTTLESKINALEMKVELLESTINVLTDGYNRLNRGMSNGNRNN